MPPEFRNSQGVFLFSRQHSYLRKLPSTCSPCNSTTGNIGYISNIEYIYSEEVGLTFWSQWSPLEKVAWNFAHRVPSSLSWHWHKSSPRKQDMSTAPCFSQTFSQLLASYFQSCLLPRPNTFNVGLGGPRAAGPALWPLQGTSGESIIPAEPIKDVTYIWSLIKWGK